MSTYRCCCKRTRNLCPHPQRMHHVWEIHQTPCMASGGAAHQMQMRLWLEYTIHVSVSLLLTLSLSLARMSLCSLMAIILVAFVLAEQRAEKIIDVKSHSLATRLCCLVTPHSAPPQPCVRVRLFAVNYNVPDAWATMPADLACCIHGAAAAEVSLLAFGMPRTFVPKILISFELACKS